MFGLRLRYQIAWFLFLLFTTVVVLMGYFNLAILNDLLARFAFFQAKTSAQKIDEIFEKSLPQEAESLEAFVKDKPLFLNVVKSLEASHSLNNFAVYDNNFNKLFALQEGEEIEAEHTEKLKQVASERTPVSVVWAVDYNRGTTKAVDNYGILDSRGLYNDYYFPISRQGELLGFIRVSLYLDTSINLQKFLIAGNSSLAFIFILTAVISIYFWTENAINKPIRILLEAQEHLRQGDFNVHVNMDVSSQNELGIIGNSFNRMTTELRQYQDELKLQATELEKVNQQYKKLNETLEQEVENKTLELREFFSLITHDLKIPLAAIKGYTSLLKKDKTGPLNEKQAHFIGSIDTAAVHLLNMVKNMLDSVKYDDGRVNYFMEDFDLLTVIKEVENQIHPIIGEKNINLTVTLDECCRQVHGDRTKIGQVISNIISNAINYSPQGGAISLVTCEVEGMVEVRISDNGTGIPPEQMPLIFEKFQRDPNKESPATSLGLGLYIVRKIMEGHETKVWAQSEEGKGSTFYFTLNKAKGKEETEPAVNQVNEEIRESEEN